jgi:hypothetical protein
VNARKDLKELERRQEEEKRGGKKMELNFVWAC